MQRATAARDMNDLRRKSYFIAPSILSADFLRLGEEVSAVEKAGADWIHVDVMDGHFVPNITIGIPIVESLKKVTSLHLDVHLMIDNPEEHVEAFVKAGAGGVTVHAEVTTHLHRIIMCIRSLGVLAGVALNPATPVYAVEEVLPYVDLVLVLSVNPGFAGQEFIEGALLKIEKLRKIIDSNCYGALIEADGGVKVSNVRRIAEAGADVFAAASEIFKSNDYRLTIEAMRREIEGVGMR